jgi:flagellar motor protein MotB
MHQFRSGGWESMNTHLLLLATFGLFATNAAWPQTQPQPGQNVPLYRVTVVERTVKAINYQYRSDPTQIDFRGTVLLPESKGDATVECKGGRTDIDAHFEHVRPPSRYGPEYLTYVLWAVTPEGHAENLGEVMAGSSDKAHLHVTTDLQAFGLIVTAEPYSAVRQPSDVVVMENEIRPDTIGRIEPIQVKYELMPRGEYTYNVPADLKAAEGTGPSVSMSEYEATVAVYQAQNALQIAKAAGADQYASDTFNRAQGILSNAQAMQTHKSDRNTVITLAREAAQTAEDARAIAIAKKHDTEIANARAQVAQEQQRRIQAEAEAQTARAEASADRAMLDQERNARQQSDGTAQVTPPPPPPPPPAATMPAQPADAGTRQKRELRMNLYQQLTQAALATTDTPRGLVVTLPDTDFEGRGVNGAVAARLSRIASIVAAHPGLMIEVDGNSDVAGVEAERLWDERDRAVRELLVSSGVPAGSITTRYLGSNRPLGPQAAQNRRIEIAISGDAIGNQPSWDRSYSLTPR